MPYAIKTLSSTGKIEGDRTELTIRTFGRLNSPEEFEDMVLRETDGVVVLLRDVAKVTLAPQNLRSILRGNGVIPMVGVAITPLPGSNYIEIADEVYKKVEQIKKDLPEDIIHTYSFDRTIAIRNAISEVEETILIAFLLVVLIIFIFLRNWRTTLIPVIAIPISLVGTFFVMYLFDFSINVLTLLGIVLSTGLVVDDAIVMMENIYRRIEEGENPLKAGHEGSKEIYFAIIATSITLVAVFLPVIFLQGITGRLFREFGIVVAGAIIISTILLLSLTPIDVKITDQRVVVRDYGRGIPLAKVVDVVSKINTGAKYDSGAFQKSVGLNGVGTKAVNALSNYFKVQAFREGKTILAEFKKGILTADPKETKTTERNGTLVEFEPDNTMFKHYHFIPDYLDDLMWNYAFLNAGLTINYSSKKFFSKDGLLDLLKQKSDAEDIRYPIIHFKGDDIEVALTHGGQYGEEYYSFVNGQNTTQGGTHLAAFREGIVRGVRDLYKKDFDAADIRASIVAAIAVRVQEPRVRAAMLTSRHAGKR